MAARPRWHAAEFKMQARRYRHELDAPPPGSPPFVRYRSVLPLPNKLTPTQLDYYRYFRAEVTAHRPAQGDIGYVFLYALELLHGFIEPTAYRTRAQHFLSLTDCSGLSQELLHTIVWWAFSASERDGPHLIYPNAAAWTVPPLQQPVHHDLALAGVAQHLEDADWEDPPREPWYDVRAIAQANDTLPLDPYGLPDDLVRNLNMAAVLAGDTMYRALDGRPLFERFPRAHDVVTVEHASFEALVSSPPPPFRLQVPAYTTSEELRHTLWALLEIGQRLTLESLGERGMRNDLELGLRANAFDALEPAIDQALRNAPYDRAYLRHRLRVARGRPSGTPPIREVWSPPPRPSVDRDHQERCVAHVRLLNERVQRDPDDIYLGDITTTDIRALDEDGLEAYLAWRTLWLEQEQVLEDANALALYAFELLNYLRGEGPQAAYDELWRVLRAYGKSYGHVPAIATEWFTHMALRFKLKDTPARAAFLTMRAWPNWRLPPALVAAGWLETRDWQALRLHTIPPVLGFDVRHGVYLAQTKNAPRYLTGLRAGARAVDEHFRAVQGLSVFDFFLPQRRWTSSLRFELRGPPMFDRYGEPAVKPRTPGADAFTTFHHFMNRALSHVENRFREVDGVRGRRALTSKRAARGADLLTPELLARVDAAIAEWLAPPKPKVKLTFDPAQVDALERRSAATRDLLVTEEARAEAEAEYAARSEPTNTTPTTAGMGETVDVETLRSPDAELAEYLAFTAALNGLHRELLEALLTGQDRAALEQVARRHDGLLGAALEAINEHALDTLGDTIMDMTDPPTILEEHREPLRAALEEAA